MKVLLVDVNCKHSSTGKIVYDLYQGINSSGNTAAICYGRGPIINETNIYKFGLDFETYFHAIMTRISGLTGFFSPLSTQRLIKYLEEYKPDVVHLHDLHGYFLNIGSLVKYLKKKRIKTIWTFHSEFMYTGKCGHANDCNKWKIKCEHCPQLREYPKSLFFDWTSFMFKLKVKLFNDFDNLTLVTPSYWLANRVKESFLGKKKLAVIYNGIDVENVFYPRDIDEIRNSLGLSNVKVVLAVASNIMSENKGGRFVLELARINKDENIKFIMIGVDNKSSFSEKNVISFNKMFDQNKLATFYSLADITLLTSSKETFSLVCAESLACGTPIVGFMSGAPSEIVPKEYGKFVDYGDINKINETLNGVLLHNMHKNSKEISEYAYNTFSIDQMVKQYLEKYGE